MKYIIVFILWTVMMLLGDTYIFNDPFDMSLYKGLSFGIIGCAIYDFVFSKKIS